MTSVGRIAFGPALAPRRDQLDGAVKTSPFAGYAVRTALPVTRQMTAALVEAQQLRAALLDLLDATKNYSSPRARENEKLRLVRDRALRAASLPTAEGA
jgi:hypothetical protein